VTYTSVSPDGAELESPEPESLSPWEEENQRQNPLSVIAHAENSLKFSGQLRLGRTVGLLLYLESREGLTTYGGRPRLAQLQKQCSLETLLSAVKFRDSLLVDEARAKSFRYHAVVLNRPFQKKNTPVTATQRIGVGYTDKGTAPDPSNQARKKASVPELLWFDDVRYLYNVQDHLDLLHREGGWVDASRLLYHYRILGTVLTPEDLRR
jgi:hypothetical protein